MVILITWNDPISASTLFSRILKVIGQKIPKWTFQKSQANAKCLMQYYVCKEKKQVFTYKSFI